jgi:molybdate transport system ATP-binding protein
MTLQVSLHHRFPGFHLHASFTAGTPGVTVLFGPSGCGKSTIVAAIAGLLSPDRGRVVLDGDTMLDTATRIDIPAERRRCGVVFQDARLFPHLSVERNLRYGLRRAPRGTPGPTFDEVVALLGVAPLLARRTARLSGGERQRVALGRALLSRPRILLMDEPLAALDDARKTELLPYFARIRDTASIPILYVTHAMDEVDQLADTLVLLDQGRVIASGPLETLTARTDLPLAARRDAGAVLACTVEAHDPDRRLTRLAFPGGHLTVPLRPVTKGARIRIRVPARDVSIARTPPQDISIQNMLPATIAAITPTASGHEAILSLALGPTTLLARLTTDAVDRLGLRPAQPVTALIKSIAFDQTGPAG